MKKEANVAAGQALAGQRHTGNDDARPVVTAHGVDRDYEGL